MQSIWRSLDLEHAVCSSSLPTRHMYVQGAPKAHFQNAIALAQTQVTGTPCVKKLIL